MKLIEIIIPDGKLYDVYNVLRKANVGGLSYHRIEGSSKVEATRFISKHRVTVVVRDDMVEELITKILDKIGGDLNSGGKIFVLDVHTAVDLPTKKRGDDAI